MIEMEGIVPFPESGRHFFILKNVVTKCDAAMANWQKGCVFSKLATKRLKGLI